MNKCEHKYCFNFDTLQMEWQCVYCGYEDPILVETAKLGLAAPIFHPEDDEKFEELARRRQGVKR